jgi:Tol biopolymer transport system component
MSLVDPKFGDFVRPFCNGPLYLLTSVRVWRNPVIQERDISCPFDRSGSPKNCARASCSRRRRSTCPRSIRSRSVRLQNSYGTERALREALSRSEVQVRDETGNLASSIPVPRMPKPRCWSAKDDSLVFSFEHGDTNNLWTMRLTSEGVIDGGVRRLTTGPEQESDPSRASNGSVAFASEEHRSQVWWAPLDGAVEANTLERIAPSPGLEEYPSLSADSRKVAFVNDPTGLRSVWLLDVPSGKQTQVAPSPFAQRFPVLSHSGSWVAYSSYERDKRPTYVVPSDGGTPQMLCADCLRVTDWTRDEAGILTVQGSPYRISRIDRKTRKQTVLVGHPAFNLMYGRYSPDDRWISFTVRKPQNRSWIAVAQVKGDSMGPVREPDWIKVSEEGPEDRANWSADGRTLYFSSSRDGHLCIWAQRLDPLTRRPAGEPFAVRHLHEAAMLQLGWSFGGGRVAMTLNESRANIWLLQKTAQ